MFESILCLSEAPIFLKRQKSSDVVPMQMATNSFFNYYVECRISDVFLDRNHRPRLLQNTTALNWTNRDSSLDFLERKGDTTHTSEYSTLHLPQRYCIIINEMAFHHGRWTLQVLLTSFTLLDFRIISLLASCGEAKVWQSWRSLNKNSGWRTWILFCFLVLRYDRDKVFPKSRIFWGDSLHNSQCFAQGDYWEQQQSCTVWLILVWFGRLWFSLFREQYEPGYTIGRSK
jgi:hypothetical protein